MRRFFIQGLKDHHHFHHYYYFLVLLLVSPLLFPLLFLLINCYLLWVVHHVVLVHSTQYHLPHLVDYYAPLKEQILAVFHQNHLVRSLIYQLQLYLIHPINRFIYFLRLVNRSPLLLFSARKVIILPLIMAQIAIIILLLQVVLLINYLNSLHFILQVTHHVSIPDAPPITPLSINALIALSFLIETDCHHYYPFNLLNFLVPLQHLKHHYYCLEPLHVLLMHSLFFTFLLPLFDHSNLHCFLAMALLFLLFLSTSSIRIIN